MHPLLPILTIISVAFVLVFVLLMQIRMKQMQQATRLLEDFRQEKVIAYTTAANFVGLESKGMKQWRGNGFFLITDTHLVFERLTPKILVMIPVQQIQRVDLVSSFLGKRHIKPILRVVFLNDQAQPDSMGILIREPQHWQHLVRNTSDVAKTML